MERVAKVEFASLGWRPKALPLYQTRKMVVDLGDDPSRCSYLELSRIYRTRPRAGAVD
jgi:hypothetical protein